MSRTVRRLPIGHSKKYGRKGYYNNVVRFDPSDIHCLKHPGKNQIQASRKRLYGLWLDAPELPEHRYNINYWSLRYKVPYAVDEPRPHKNSSSGPKWVNFEEFYSKETQALIAKGWTYNFDYDKKITGPEEWNYDYINPRPGFRTEWVWYPNPDFDEELQDEYYDWHCVHVLVHRNGHYKDRHPGRNWRKASKQADHQLRRARLKRDLLKEMLDYEE